MNLFSPVTGYPESLRLVKRLSVGKKRFVTAESLTAGLIAAAVADIPGASAVLWGGYICYDTAAKNKLVGVKPETIDRFGAVSPETAAEMAEGALISSGSDVSVAVTGIAGPGRMDSDPPVGTVDIACAVRADSAGVRVETTRKNFKGSRNRIRKETVKAALTWVNDCLDRY